MEPTETEVNIQDLVPKPPRPNAMVQCSIYVDVCELITSAAREVKDSRRSRMYQSYHFLTRLGKQSL